MDLCEYCLFVFIVELGACMWLTLLKLFGVYGCFFSFRALNVGQVRLGQRVKEGTVSLGEFLCSFVYFIVFLIIFFLKCNGIGAVRFKSVFWIFY